MLKYRFIILQFFFLLFIISPSKSDNKVAYINLDLILSESNSGKILIFELKEFESQILENFNKQEKKLKEEENQILSTQNIVSKEEFKTKVKNFRNKLKNMESDKKKSLIEFRKKKNKEILKLLELVNPLIEEIMNNKGIEILLEKKSVFIAKSNNDITNIVIESMNKNVKNFSIKKND
jgi:outer membrane protein